MYTKQTTTALKGIVLGILMLGIGTRTLNYAQATDSEIAHNEEIYVAHLSGGQEVPAVETQAHGKFELTVEKNSGNIGYHLSVENGKNINAAHLHCGAMRQNGPVVVGLYHSETAKDVNGNLASGQIQMSDIMPHLQDCQPGIATSAHLLQAIREGKIYVNVHSVDYPNGVIRGQMMPGADSQGHMGDDSDMGMHENMPPMNGNDDMYHNLKDYAQYGAHLLLSDYYVMPPDDITVKGYYFWPNEDVKVMVMGKTFTAQTDSRGYFATPVVNVALDQADTIHTVTAHGESSNLSRSATLMIGNYYPTVEPSNWYLKAGEMLTFNGRGYGPNEAVTMIYGGVTTNLTADAQGMFSISTTVPSAAGIHEYTFKGSNSKSTYAVSVTVAQ